MKLKHYLNVLFLTLTLCGYSQTERACKASVQNDIYFKNHPESKVEYQKFNTFTKNYILNTQQSKVATYTIPVVFHVYGNIQHGKTITADKIKVALEKLNDDFTGLNPDFTSVDPFFDARKSTLDIEFKLAKLDPNGNCTDGVVFYPEKGGYGNGGGYDSQIANDAWDNYKYMNVYIQGDLYDNGGTTSSGVAWYPSTSMSNSNTARVVYNGQYLHGNTNAEFASVLTHEFGHWLNLIHTFQGGCTYPNDQVSDTPPEDGSTTGTSCSPNTNCEGDFINYENYMGYNGAAYGCYKMFTLGQTNRMLAALQHPARQTLWQAQNLIDTGVNNTGASLSVDNNVIKELVVNNGSFNQTITVTINDADFVSSTGTLTQGVDYIMALPQGLSSTSQITSLTTATITITGTTTSHLKSDNQAVNLAFNNSSFAVNQNLACTSISLNVKFYDPFEIIYENITDAIATTGATWKWFELPKINGNSKYGAWKYDANTLKLETYGKKLVAETSSRNISLIPSNTLISLSSNFTAPNAQPNLLDLRTSAYTVWDGQIGYIGFSAIHNEEPIHGWMKAGVSADGNTMTIFEYAFSTEPNGDILTGQTLIDINASELLYENTNVIETEINDGTINSTIVINLSGPAQFANKTYVNGTDFTTTIPTNFTTTINYINSTQVELTVSGTSMAHAVSDSANYTVTFKAPFFASGYSEVVNATNTVRVDYVDPYTIISGTLAGVSVDVTNNWKWFSIPELDENYNAFGGWHFGVNQLKIETYGRRLVTETSSRNISLIPNNTLISTTNNFTFPGSYPDQLDLYTTTYTTWATQTGYVGFESKYNGKTVLGWLKITVTANGDGYTVTDYAFYTKPLGSIKSGQTTLNLTEATINLNNNNVTEASSDTGIMSEVITFNISGPATFANKTFVNGTDFTTTIPAEFTTDIIYLSDTQIQLTITGTATNHAISDSETYTVELLSPAFSTGFSDVINATSDINFVYIDNTITYVIKTGPLDITVDAATTWNPFSVPELDTANSDNYFGAWISGGYLRIETYSKPVITHSGTTNSKMLGNNYLITTADDWNTAAGAKIISRTSYTDWNGNTGYLGFQSKYNGEVVHGWLKIAVVADGTSYHITEYAFYTKPNGSILTGEGALDVSTFNLDSLDIYPNPSNSTTYISGLTDVAKIEIYSITGQRLFSKTYSTLLDRVTVNHNIDATGIYFMTINSNGKTSTRKLIIK